jgi:hypothetical protein
MTGIIKKLSILLCCFFFTTLMYSQLVVQTTVLPPYSPYLSDYTTYGNKVVVMVTNPTPTPRTIKLLGSITGNGISISIPTNFLPPAPIVIPSSGTIQLSGSQLSPYYNTTNLLLQGITESQLVNGNGLPEGNYMFCYYAADYATGTPLSSQSMGCANVTITHHEPPFLLQPMCDKEVNPKTPQNLLFTWTVPAGANPINIEYELTMVELLQGQNPNQALDAATEPVFFRKTVSVSTYMYTQIDPNLQVGRKYAWRVRAKPKPGKNANFKNNGISAACTFNYALGLKNGGGNGGNQDPNADPNLPNDDNACFASCDIAEPQNKSPYGPVIDDVVSIGKFAMKIQTINGGNGTGEITIPFLKTKVLVDFTNLQVNTDLQAFGTTKAVARIEGNNLIDQGIANDQNGVIQMTREKYNSINNYVNQAQKLVSKFNPDMPATGVPFGFDNNGMNLQIVGLIFTPTKGYMNAIFGYDMADWFGNDFVDFSQKGICIRPNGFGVQPKFSLANDKTIQLSEHVDLKFLKGNNTYLELDCDGIKTVKIAGEYMISRDKLLPVENDNIVQGNTRVKVPFSVVLSEGGNFMFNTAMQPSTFTIPDAQDFRFTADEIILDMHNTQNPNGLTFHNNHPKHGGNNQDWKGLYMGSISASLPDGFKKGNTKISFAVQDLMIDKTGFWGDISVNNVVSIDNGSVGNWKFSIVNLTVNIEASALAGGSMDGGIKIPIAETALGYSAAIQKGNNGVNWQFAAEIQNNLEAGLWLATLSLNEGSTVSIEKDGNKIIPSAILNGSITIGFNSSPNQQTPLSKLSLNGIQFQELTVTGGGEKPVIGLQFVSLANQPGGMFSMNKFPINLTALSYDNGLKPGITFGLKVNLSKGSNAFEAETDLKVLAKWNGGQKKFDFEGIELKKITIDADLGVMSVVGTVNLYKEDAVYGTGFRGDLEASLKFASIAINATIQLGKIGDTDPTDETGSNYRYFFIDIGARWGVGGLPIPGVGAVAFYGFGGGIYRNMDRQSVAAVTNDKIPDKQGEGTMNAGETRSGVVYTPKKGTFGFMASVTLGTTGEPTSFNGDLKLTVQFNTDNFGVTKVIIDGKAYLLGPIADRSKRLLEVGIEIEMDFEKPMFHAAVTIDGGFNKSALNVTVKASLALHFEPGLWYVKLGEWTNDDEPWNDPKRIQVDISLGSQVLSASLNFNAYFMMGNDIGDLPRSPLKVREALGLNNQAGGSKPTDTKVFIGKGFALGAGIRFTANANFFVFYADVEFIFGADLLLAKSPVTCNGSSDYGINGWYAKGIAYAYLHGDVGLRLKMWGFEGKFSLLEFMAAAQMKAEMPNPIWIKGDFAIQGSILNGMIKVKTRFGFEVGTRCQWGDGSSDMLPIIAEILPENGNDGSVFEAPQAAFNFVVNKEGGTNQFTIKHYNKRGKARTRTFKVEISKVELKLGNTVVAGTYHLNTAGNGITFIPKNTLEEKKNYTFTVEATAFEKISSKWTFVKTEDKATTFKTGLRPDYIPEENLVSAYPQIGQRYFLPKDEPKGNIRVGLSQCYLMDKKEDKDFKYEYKLRMINQETKKVTEVPFTCSDDNFFYNMPNSLAKETVYEVSVFRIAKPKQPPVNTKVNTEFVYRNEKGEVINAPTEPGNKFDNKGFGNKSNNKGGGQGMQFGGGKVNNNQSGDGDSKLMVRHNTVKEQRISGSTVEKELFKYYFRTSKHNTAEEKFNAYKTAGTAGQQNYAQTAYVAGTLQHYATSVKFPLLQGQENMDSYDAYGYYKEKFDIKVEPLASTNLVWGSNSYFDNINTRIYEHRYKGSGNPTSQNFAFNRYADGNTTFFGLDKQLFDRRPIQAIKVWHSSTEGPINIAENQSIMQPKTKLTSNEINKAKQGQKIVEQYPKNPVLPLNYYLPTVVLLDGIAVYAKHRSRCYSDHVLGKNERKCINSHALPAITYNPGSGFPNYSPYDLTVGLNYKFKITYGYLSEQPFTKELTFKP